jgi:uncharacterized membrane protein YraQ (UPF0718 family)
MTTPTLSIASLLVIAAASTLLPGFGAALAMSTASVYIAVVAGRWMREDYGMRQWARKLDSDEREQAALRAWNKHKAEEVK